MEGRFGMALYRTTEVGKMKKSYYYSICFYLVCIWQCVAEGRTLKDFLMILAVFYLIDMIISAYKGE